MKTKLLTFLAASVLGASAFAGETYLASKNTLPLEKPPLYPDHEFTVDLFGAGAFTESTNDRVLGDHAWGGGLAVNYFFTRNIGIGLEGQALKSQNDGEDVIGTAALNVFYRLPIGESGWAPYLYGGGGVLFNTESDFGDITDSLGDEIDDAIDDEDRSRGNNDNALFEGHAGLGVEYRFTRHIGAFTDARWNFVDDRRNNFPSARAGVRFAF